MINRSEAYRSVEVAILDEDRQFAELEEEWEELYRECPRATPFQSWAWLYSWWEHYGKRYELRLITVRSEDGLLVGLLPLMLERRGGLGRLLFVGTGVTDYLDALVREGWEEQVAAAGVLGSVGSWWVADLQGLRPNAAAWDLLEGWSGFKAIVWQENCPFIDARPWDELIMSVSKNLRSTARRTLRRAEVDGVSCEAVGQAEVEQAARRLVALNREAWQGRNIGPEHLTRRFESHMITAACRMTACGLGSIYEFRRDGEVVISDLVLFGRDFVGAYMTGVSREGLRRYQWSSLCVWDGMHIALSRNTPRFDLLRGEESYKLRWSSGTVANHRLILGRNALFWTPYAAYFALRSKLKRYVDSESAPNWTKEAKKKYHISRQGFRRGVARVRKLLNEHTGI